MASVIFHVDLNAFFAMAEIARHPEYSDCPVAIGTRNKRGVLSTANYKARSFGVHSAMPIYEALRLCPELVIIPPDFSYYKSLSSKFFAYLKTFTPYIEIASIDECYMDVTQVIKQYKRPLDLAYQILIGVEQTLGLSVSIGVAPNRFLAKMASDMRKPKGITVLRKSELSTKLWPLPIEDMFGIGKKTIPLLKKNGIEKIGDLVDEKNEALILRLLGKSGYVFIQRAKGQSSAKLHVSTSAKSVSISRTLNTDLYTREEVLVILLQMVKSMSSKLVKENIKGKLVSITLRDTQFHTIVRSISLEEYTNDAIVIYEKVQGLVEENFEPVGYRHVGVTLGSLQNVTNIVEQPTIFEPVKATTDSILSDLNHKLQFKGFIKASDLLKKEDQ